MKALARSTRTHHQRRPSPRSLQSSRLHGRRRTWGCLHSCHCDVRRTSSQRRRRSSRNLLPSTRQTGLRMYIGPAPRRYTRLHRFRRQGREDWQMVRTPERWIAPWESRTCTHRRRPLCWSSTRRYCLHRRSRIGLDLGPRTKSPGHHRVARRTYRPTRGTHRRTIPYVASQTRHCTCTNRSRQNRRRRRRKPRLPVLQQRILGRCWV